MTKKKSKKTANKSNTKTKGSSKLGNNSGINSHTSNNTISLLDEKSANERQRVEKFWFNLHHDTRKKIVRIEKHELLKKIKEKHRHICSCTVCGRKRAVIDREVEKLYDQYCEELEFRNSGLQRPTCCPHHHHHIHHHASLPQKDQVSVEYKQLQQKQLSLQKHQEQQLQQLQKLQQLQQLQSQQSQSTMSLNEAQASVQSAAELLARQQKQLQQLQQKQKQLQMKHRQQQKEQQLLQQQKQQLQELQLLQKKSEKCIALGAQHIVNNLTKATVPPNSSTTSTNSGNIAASTTVISTSADSIRQNQSLIEDIKTELNGKQITIHRVTSPTPANTSSVVFEEEDQIASVDALGAGAEEMSSDSTSEASQNSSDWSGADDFTSDEFICWNFGRNLIVQNGAITISDAWMAENGANVIDLFHRFEKCDSGSSDRLEMMMLGSANGHRNLRKPNSIGARAAIRTSKITTTTGAITTTTELPNGTVTTSKTTSRNGTTTTCTETTTKVNNGTTTITTTTYEENIDDEEYSDAEESDDAEYSDDDEDDDESDDEDDDEDDESDEDESDSDTEASKWRESKKMFRMYAAKLFYEKIVMAFKEKLAIEMQNALIDEEEQREKERQQKEKKNKENQLKKKKKEEEKERKRKEKELQEQKDRERKLQEQKEKEKKRVEEERKKIEQEMIALAKKQLEESRQQEELERQKRREREQQEREERRLREEKERQEKEAIEAQIHEQQKKNAKKTKKKAASKPETPRHPSQTQQTAAKKSAVPDLRPPSPLHMDEYSEDEFAVEIQNTRITPKDTIAEAASSQFEVYQEHGVFKEEATRILDRKVITKPPTPVLTDSDKVIEKPNAQRRTSVTSSLLENSVRISPHEHINAGASFNSMPPPAQSSPFSWGAPATPSPISGGSFLPQQQSPFAGQAPSHQLFGPGVFNHQQQIPPTGSVFGGFNPWISDPFQQTAQQQMSHSDHSFNTWGPQPVQHAAPEYNAFYGGFGPFGHQQQPGLPTPVQRNPNPSFPPQQVGMNQSSFNPMAAFMNSPDPNIRGHAGADFLGQKSQYNTWL